MQDTISTPTSNRQPLRRLSGPVGGVCAGLGRTFGIDKNLIRVAAALAAVVLGPIVVLAYLVSWLAMPVDEWLSEDERPGSVPKALLGVFVAVIAAQFLIGVVTNVPVMWIILGAVAAWWIVTRD